MKKFLKITVFGTLKGTEYRSFVQKKAEQLNIAGTIQYANDQQIIILAEGDQEAIEDFIDYLYEGTKKSIIEKIETTPYLESKQFRGLFRILGEEKI
jgi:acylphosphatase